MQFKMARRRTDKIGGIVPREQDLQTQELREKGLLFAVSIAMPTLILLLWELTTRLGWVDALF